MINRTIAIWGIILLFACKTKDVVKKVDETEVPKPSWVKSRPINSLDYIGIGVAQIAPGVNFIESAKNNALNDLASEIKVNLESNTVYFQTERDGVVKEDFKSTITTTAAADIEGFEIAGTWQDANEYWVYYRLSKSDYLKRVEDKRNNAKKISLEHLANALESQEKGDIKLAIQQYFDAFSAIQAYPPSSIEVDDNGNSTSLDQLIFSKLQQLFSTIHFKNEGQTAQLDFSNRFAKHVLISIDYKNMAVGGVPVIQEFKNKYGPVTKTVYTNEKGSIDVLLKAKSLKPSKLKMDIYFDIKKLIGNRKDGAYLEQKMAVITIPRYAINAEVVAPYIFVTTDERLFGSKTKNNGLKSILVSELVKEGVQIIDQLSKADLKLEINADTKLQSTDNNFTVVGLNYSIKIIEVKTNKTILSLDEGPIKGVSLDQPRAAEKAYEKCEAELKRIEIRKIKSAILDF